MKRRCTAPLPLPHVRNEHYSCCRYVLEPSTWVPTQFLFWKVVKDFCGHVETGVLFFFIFCEGVLKKVFWWMLMRFVFFFGIFWGNELFVERYIQKHDIISIIGCEMMYLCFNPFSWGVATTYLTVSFYDILKLCYWCTAERERESSPSLELHRSESRWRNSQKVA